MSIGSLLRPPSIHWLMLCTRSFVHPLIKQEKKCVRHALTILASEVFAQKDQYPCSLVSTPARWVWLSISLLWQYLALVVCCCLSPLLNECGLEPDWFLCVHNFYRLLFPHYVIFVFKFSKILSFQTYFCRVHLESFSPLSRQKDLGKCSFPQQYLHIIELLLSIEAVKETSFVKCNLSNISCISNLYVWVFFNPCSKFEMVRINHI